MPTNFGYVSKPTSSAGRFPLDGVWMQDCTAGAPSLIDPATFADIVAAVPLAAIDLIVEDDQGNVLLGRRRNPPAKGCWFVPGGRIRKDETLDAAFCRIAASELGQDCTRTQARLLDIFEQFYDVNFRGTPGETTHLIVQAYRLRVDPEALRLPAEQHSEYAWMRAQTASRHPQVHPYAQVYFQQLYARQA